MFTKEEQITYLISNTVLYDGIGDFSHFMDFLSFLFATGKYSDINFIIIIYSEHAQDTDHAKKIMKDLALLCDHRPNIITYIRYPNPCDGSLDASAPLEIMEKIHQVIHISCLELYIIEDFVSKQYNQYLPIKILREHEGLSRDTQVFSSSQNTVSDYSMGLGSGRLGIKITPQASITDLDSWNIILQNDADFIDKLLAITSTSTINALLEHAIIPAYFNKAEDFLLLFLPLIFGNSGLFAEKKPEILLYYSGKDLLPLFESSTNVEEKLKTYLINSNISAIEIYTATGVVKTISITTPSIQHKKIIILTKFFITDNSYNAIYQLAKIAGVSGDNTFERAISTKTLPFYRSTNHKIKQATLEGLILIIQSLGSISESLKENFKLFFANEINLDVQLNFAEMIDYWPIICDELVAHYNIYDHLENFVLSSLPLTSCPAAYLDDPNLLRYICDNYNSLITLIRKYDKTIVMQQLNTRDYKLKIMLHYAAHNSKSLKLILEQYENKDACIEALNTLDLEGNLPIHYIQNNTESLQIILNTYQSVQREDIILKQNYSGLCALDLYNQVDNAQIMINYLSSEQIFNFLQDKLLRIYKDTDLFMCFFVKLSKEQQVNLLFIECHHQSFLSYFPKYNVVLFDKIMLKFSMLEQKNILLREDNRGMSVVGYLNQLKYYSNVYQLKIIIFFLKNFKDDEITKELLQQLGQKCMDMIDQNIFVSILDYLTQTECEHLLFSQDNAKGRSIWQIVSQYPAKYGKLLEKIITLNLRLELSIPAQDVLQDNLEEDELSTPKSKASFYTSASHKKFKDHSENNSIKPLLDEDLGPKKK